MGNQTDRKIEKAKVTSAASMVKMAVCAALIAVCAWLTIPMTVPFTLQTFAVFLTLKLLGGRRGTIAILIYILLGAVGLPVFASFKGGMSALMGPTGGYIIGFLLTGLLYWGLERIMKNTWIEDAVLVAGLLLCYLFGTVWFTHVMSLKGNSLTLFQGLTMCVFPYIIPDLLKLALADLLGRRLKRFV